ncbi:hypothetical protein BG004_000024 [Podila humilis]|nr:hypothetical protein BG004_000024 [Podila humilis]
MSSVDNASSSATKSKDIAPLPALELKHDATALGVSSLQLNPKSAEMSSFKEDDVPSTSVKGPTLPPNTPVVEPSNTSHSPSMHVTASQPSPVPQSHPHPPPPLIVVPNNASPVDGPNVHAAFGSAQMNHQNDSLSSAQPTAPVLSENLQTANTTLRQTIGGTAVPEILPGNENSVALIQDNTDHTSIASDVQEHSNGSLAGSHLVDLLDLDEIRHSVNRLAQGKDADLQAANSRATNVLASPTASTQPAHAIEAPVSVLSQPKQSRVTPTEVSVQVQNMSQETEAEDLVEPTASYTSPNHEWARILQRRLNKGLNDAQLARSNSMLASPSIIAQSLVQVIPALQVKDASRQSPDSPVREYQTAEELFDRPASIEPSTKYDDAHTSRDDAFPSANVSSAPLLLFAPLNPDDLQGKSKSSKSSKPPKPLAPPVSGSQGSGAVAKGEDQSICALTAVQSTGLLTSETQEQKDNLDDKKRQHQQLAPSTVQPTSSSTIAAGDTFPTIPAIKASPSVDPLAQAIVSNPSPASQSPSALAPPASPSFHQTPHSPMLTKDQAKNPMANVNLSVNTRTLVSQGSLSSLTGAQGSAIPKDVPGPANHPINPIQYTPLTQYKANPAKKQRDASASSTKDVRSMDSPKDLKMQPDGKLVSSIDSATVLDTNVETATTSAGMSVDQWTLEALSGLTDFKFDTSLPVSAVVATTLAGSSAPAGSTMKHILPTVPTPRRGSSASDAPIVAKVIQSPFESNRLSQIIPPSLQGMIAETSMAPVPEVSLQPASVVHDIHTVTSDPTHTEALYQKSAGPGFSGQEHHDTNGPVRYGYVARGHQTARSVSSLGDFQLVSKPLDRSSIDNISYRRVTAPSAPPMLIPTPALNLGSGYQISWLPQSRPVLPPRADVNSIDVPALAGKQMLPHDPRPIRGHSKDPSSQFRHLGEALRHWGVHRPEGNAFASIEGKGSECGSMDWALILGKAELIAKNIHEKTQLPAGARVALVYRLSEILEFIAAFYGAMLAGVVPVLVNQIQEFSEMVYIMTSAKVELALTTQTNHKSLMKDVRKGTLWPSGVTWWRTDGNETWSPKKGEHERIPLKKHDLAYIEYTKSANGELKGIAVSHKNLMAQCRALHSSFVWRPALYRDKNGKYQTDPTLAVESPPDHLQALKIAQEEPTVHGTVMSWLEPRQQSGLVVGCIMGVYLGNFTVFVDSSISAISGLWAHSAAAYRANIAFADYSGMQRLLRNFRLNPQGTVTPTRPDLRFLQTIYVDTPSNNPKFNREFLDEFMYPLGMIQRLDTPPNTKRNKGASDNNNSDLRMTRGDLGVLPYFSLPEHGGAIISVRDGMDPLLGTDKIDLRKQYRKSTMPQNTRASEDAAKGTTVGDGVTLTTESKSESPVATPVAKETGELGKLANHPVSSFSSAEYLLQRNALRLNSIVVLATGDEAVRRMDEPGAILVGAFGYSLGQTLTAIVDPETLALTLPDVVGEIWISSPTLPVCFWGLPEHTQEVFNAKPFVISEEEMVPTVYRSPKGYDKFLRTGMLGTMIEGRLVVFGPYSKRLQQDKADPLKPIGAQFEYHHSSDLASTLHGHVNGVGELSIFECFVNGEFLPVICIELSKECRLASQTIGTIAHNVAINAHHVLKERNGLRPYCIAVWEANTLPRMFENGRRVIDHALCKKMFELGRIFKILHFSTFIGNVMFNIPHGDDLPNGFWSRECVAKRQQRQGSPQRYVQYTANVMSLEAFDEKNPMGMSKFHTVTDILIWRTITQQDEIAFIELDHRGKEQKAIPFKKFNHKVTGCAMYLDKKCGLKHGDHVILWFIQDLEYIVTLHACWALGLIPIPLALPDQSNVSQSFMANNTYHPHNAATGMTMGTGMTFAAVNQPSHTPNPFPPKLLEEKRNNILRAMLRIMDEVKIKAILGNNATDDYLRQKSTISHLRSVRSNFNPQYCQTPELTSQDATHLPTFHNVTKAAKTKQLLGALSGYAPRREWFTSAYPAVYLTNPDAGMTSVESMKLLKLNHETLNNLCRNQKLQFKMVSGKAIVTCLSIFHGMGFVQGCCTGIYNGGPSVIIQPVDFSANPVIWLEALTRYKVQDAALTYPLLEQVLMRLDGTQGMPIQGQVVLDALKNLVILSHGRTQRDKITTAIARLGQYKMEAESMNMVYSHPLNFMVTSQLDRALGPIRIHVSSRQLRYGIVAVTSEVEDSTGIWLEDVGVATTYTSVAVVHPETFEVCSANQIGEIWIQADSCVSSFHTPAGFTSNAAQSFSACIAGYDSRSRYVRTGDLGFLWNGQQQHLMQLQALANQGQRNALQVSAAAGSGSFQLFVLGSMHDAFQVHGLLHFAQDIESTAEGAHANVAPQGCISFKTPGGQVVVVVKVVSQEPEVLVSMYIPLMHAILEQHQFVPDVLALVGDTVATTRRSIDGLKPRDTISSLYNSERLTLLHLHHCHGVPSPPVPNTITMSPSMTRGGSSHPYSQPTNAAQQVSVQQTVYSQPQPTLASNGGQGGRFVANIGSAPMTGGRVAQPHLHIPAYGSSTPEPQVSNNNRSSLYGSPLLVANIPLPPGVHNPLVLSPHSSTGQAAHVGYQPHSQYHPNVSTSGAMPGGTVVIPTQALPSSQSSHGAFAQGGSSAAASIPRPVSQQAFLSSPPHSGGSANGSGHNFLSELSMYNSGGIGTNATTIRGPNSKGQQQSSQIRHHSQTQLSQSQQPQSSQQQQHQQRPAHARQITSTENRSSSAEELRGDPKSGVKSFMKGVNAKLTEIRKAGL